MFDLERQSALRSRCIDICQAILTEEIGLIEGIRSLVSLGFEMGCEDEKPFLGLRGIDSQSDHFPLGEFRDFWDKDALAREDTERAEFERDFREQVVANCKELVDRFRNARTIG